MRYSLLSYQIGAYCWGLYISEYLVEKLNHDSKFGPACVLPTASKSPCQKLSAYHTNHS